MPIAASLRAAAPNSMDQPQPKGSIMKNVNNNIANSQVKSAAHQIACVKSEETPKYEVQNEENSIIAKALSILAKRMKQAETYINSPAIVKSYLQLRMADLQHEVFSVVFLDAQHGVIETEEMFRGTLTQTSVYPREVVKRALSLNAAAVIFGHNHPSGNTEPSRSDELLTDALKQALGLIDVRVLDHIIVAGAQTLSFAERGLI